MEPSLEFRPIRSIDAPPLNAWPSELHDPSKPVVLRGAAREWPALERWSTGHFSAHYGDAPVPVIAHAEEGAFRLEAKQLNFEKRKLSSALADLGSGAPLFISAPIECFPARIREDYRLPVPYDSPWSHKTKIALHITGAGIRVPLHRDLPCNFNVQLVGKKRWILFGPRDDARVYPIASFGSRLYPYPILGSRPARVNAEDPDFERFPLFRGTVAHECVLGPGDALLFPSLYWHQTRTQDFSISLACWFAHGLLAALCWVSDFAKKMLGMGRMI